MIRVRKPKSSNEIRFTVFGGAVPKARARVVRNKPGTPSAGVHAFTPKTTAEWEASIYGQSLAQRPERPWEGPVALGLAIYLPIPKSTSKRNRALALEGKLRPIKRRGDLTNYIKSVEDALNGIYWLDDAQIVEYVSIDGTLFGKYYSETPRIEVLVRFIDER